MTPLLQVSGLRKAFGGVVAVAGVEFELAAGELLSLIGPNGAGKSTCFNMINGQLPPDAGQVLFEGRNIAGMKPRDIWRLGVGRTFQVAATYGSMSVVENVQMALLSHHRELMRMWTRAAARHRSEAMTLLDSVGLAGRADEPCATLAYGDIKTVELAIALANSPKLLLMDEPTAGMAPRERNALMTLTRRLVKERGIGVLFTEHSMDVVFAHSDRIMVLARGQLIAQGRPDDIRNDPKVREVYFGSGKLVKAVEPAESGGAGGLGMTTGNLLSVSGLNAFYGRAHILFDLALQVGAGEVVALMGRNGAGKSTTMKSIMGLVPDCTGQVSFDGRAITGLDPFLINRAGIGWVPEDRRVFTDLTVLENLEVGRRPPRAGAPVWTIDKLFKLFPNLGEMPNRPGGRMSGGEQQMLTVARTLMGNPRLVLLDEPSEGVAPVIVEQMAHMIVELKNQGLSVLLSEQNLPFASAVSDRAYVLEKGQVKFAGTMAELDDNDEIRRQYLTV